MAKRINRLSPIYVKSKTEPGYHPDGNGLYLQISKTGTKSWIYRFTLNGKTREMGLGPEHTISLTEARDLATEKRKLVLKGIDPIEERKSEKQAQVLAAQKRKSFQECAEDFIKAKRPEWKNAKYADQVASQMATYAYPIIGSVPIPDINTQHICDVLRPIWTEKTDTASKVLQKIRAVLDYAEVQQLRSGKNPATWTGHLAHLFPSASKLRSMSEENQPALPYTRMNEFMQALQECEPSASSMALEFLILTTTRSNETMGAKWSEIDLDEKVWTIPAARMGKSKDKIDHRVPLSAEAIQLLEEMKERKNGPYVFPGRAKDSQLSSSALLEWIRRSNEQLKKLGLPPWLDPKTGREAVPHGFRSSFSDWANEETLYHESIIEMALAHTVGSKVKRAYHRGDLFQKRRQLMDDWARYCYTGQNTGNVIPIMSSAAA